jgi:hypothetical protein
MRYAQKVIVGGGNVVDISFSTQRLDSSHGSVGLGAVVLLQEW